MHGFATGNLRKLFDNVLKHNSNMPASHHTGQSNMIQIGQLFQLENICLFTICLKHGIYGLKKSTKYNIV